MVSPPVFFGSYTAVVKQYCDREFFSRVVAQLPSALLAGSLIIDNSKGENADSDGYLSHLHELAAEVGASVNLLHIDVERDPRPTRLHRRITESTNLLRDLFLASPAAWLLIVEADVIPPVGFLPIMLEKAEGFDVFGLPYYRGFHPGEWFATAHDQVIDMAGAHVLSGCTLYSRRLLKEIEFRYDPERLGPLPDAWICHDALRLGKGFRTGNYTGLKCEHLSMPNGYRGWENL